MTNLNDVPESVEPTPAKPWYLKKRFWAIGIIGLVVIGSAATQGPSVNPPSSEVSQSTETSGTDESGQEESVLPSEDPVEPEPEEPALTVSQMNAIESAQSYLDYSAFSRKGLIEQLEFEDYSTADATFAVDYVDVDWNEQAAKSAAEYLDYSSFSRQGLIDQLLFEGFTQKQAEYGVSTTGL